LGLLNLQFIACQFTIGPGFKQIYLVTLSLGRAPMAGAEIQFCKVYAQLLFDLTLSCSRRFFEQPNAATWENEVVRPAISVSNESQLSSGIEQHDFHAAGPRSAPSPQQLLSPIGQLKDGSWYHRTYV